MVLLGQVNLLAVMVDLEGVMGRRGVVCGLGGGGQSVMRRRLFMSAASTTRDGGLMNSLT